MEIFLIIMLLFLFPYDIIHLCIFMRNFMMQYISKSTKFKIFVLYLYVKIFKVFFFNFLRKNFGKSGEDLRVVFNFYKLRENSSKS